MVMRFKKWCQKIRRKYLKNKCYYEMENMGIAVFGMCSGKNEASCRDCPCYVEI